MSMLSNDYHWWVMVQTQFDIYYGLEKAGKGFVSHVSFRLARRGEGDGSAVAK